MALGSQTRTVAAPCATADEVSDWLDGITYRAGWTFDVEPSAKHTMLVIRAATTDSRGSGELVVTHRFSLPARAVVNDRASFDIR